MSDLLSSTLGAVGQVGDAIDKFTGGRAVRGTLAGKPRELASVIPFSDSLGLTKASDATSGRDLTDSYGITTKGANDFGSHAAGFLADNILSPGNMLGAYGAFKAAPTLSKGIAKGAKALSGLDLIDHLGAGAKKVGGFVAGESGAAKIPPLPIDVANMKETSLAANATRPRRYSVDPARKDWYSSDRQARFGRHFGGGPGNTSVPSGIPKFSLNDAFHRFANDESGALDMSAFSKHRKTAPRVAAVGSPAAIAQDAINRTGDAFGGSGGALDKTEARDLASSFIRPPQFDQTPEGVAKAQEFASTLGKGRTAAGQYFGALYRDINKHLRDLGGSAGDEIAAIRSGRYRGQVPHEMPGHPIYQAQGLKPHQQTLLDQFYHDNGFNKDTFSNLDPDDHKVFFDGLTDHFGPNADIYKNHIVGQAGIESTTAPGSPPHQAQAPGGFTPDQGLLDAFKSTYGTDPYTMMGDWTKPPWVGTMNEHFGDQAGDYIKHYEDMAKADGSWTGAHPPSTSGVAPHRLPDIRDAIEGLMGLLDHSRMPKTMDLYRGVDGKGLPAIEKLLGAPLNSPEAIGREFTDPAFLSTAFDKGDADSFAGLSPGHNLPNQGVTFTFPNVPEGKPASMMNASENEILFPPGRKIKITDNSNYPHLKAELYGTLLAAIMGGRAANNYGGRQNGGPQL